MKVTGGKSLYGASLGILMLDARFPRIEGEVGNARTWPFPVHYRIVRGASPDLIVLRGAEGTLDAFIDAARALVADGVDGVATNCGFLSLFQRELAAAVNVPVASSSLMQVPMVQALLPPGRRVGVLTISAETLTPRHLALASVPEETPIVGTDPSGEFSRVILGDEETIDVERARRDNVDAALDLVKRHPEVGAIVLECTNMCPYADDIRRATGRPVFSMVTFLEWFHAGLQPTPWPAPRG
ncbi:MAG: aspartate/glutamate racemase family protein, partial [Pseudomonadota bacterium]